MNLIWKFLTFVGFCLPPYLLPKCEGLQFQTRLRATPGLGQGCRDLPEQPARPPTPRAHTRPSKGPFAQIRGSPAGGGGVGRSGEDHGGPGAPMSGSHVVFLMAPTSLKPALGVGGGGGQGTRPFLCPSESPNCRL